MADSQHILIVDDEPDLREVIELNLVSEGYRVSTAADAYAALKLIEHDPPDLIVLDVMMPGVDGIELAKRLRIDHATRSLPILMLTAKGTEHDEISGLGAGADDYMPKPFSVAVLRARIDALLRRSSGRVRPSRALSLGPVELDQATHEATLGGQPVTLTLTEFRILASLIAAGGEVCSRRALITQAIGPGISVTERTIDVHVTAIRRKLGEASAMIRTVRGVGYRAVLERADASSG